MQFIVYAIIPIVVALVLPIATTVLRRNIIKKEREISKQGFSMRASKSFCIMLIIFTFIFALIIALLNILDEMLLATNIVLYVVEVFLVVGCIQALRQKIVITGNEIVYTPIFGKTNKYTFGDIKKVVESYYSRGMIKYKVYSNDKKIFVFSNYAVGSRLLLQRFKEKGIEISSKSN